MSIAAVSGQKIEEQGFTKLADLSAQIPNFHISSATVNDQIIMRGIGSGSNRGFEQSVGMFIDGVYMGRGKQSRSPFLDLDRVEVLRGPQSVLFGKNTIAGAVSLHTARPVPGDELNGSIFVSYEPEYNTHEVRAVISGSITDEFALRLAVKDAGSDGYIENTFLDQDGPETDDQNIRLSFAWEPTADLTINGKYERAESDRTGGPAEVFRFEPLTGLAGFVANVLVPAADPKFDTELNWRNSMDEELVPNTRELETDNAAVTIEYDWGGHTLTSVTGYSAYEADEKQDVDFLPIAFLSSLDDHEFEQWSQEIRLASPGGETFDYITGIYWQTNELDMDVSNDIGVEDTVAPVFLPLYDARGWTAAGLYPVDASRYGVINQKSDTYSAFFQGPWNVTDTLRLIAGGRYTKEEKEYVRNGGHAVFATREPAGANEDLMLSVLGIAVTLPHYDNDRTENQFSPSLKAQWDISDEIMLYASAEKGFKGGGFNADQAATLENQEFEEEEAIGYELGMKSTLLDGSAELNVALFRTEFDDQQVTSFDGISFIVGNAAQATVQGIEMDGQWQITDSIRVGGAVGYLDAEYDDYENGPCSVTENAATGATTCDLSGKDLMLAPEWSGSAYVDYSRPVADSLELRVYVDITYSDETYMAADLDPFVLQDSYTKLNARLAIGSADGQWELAVVGKNLTDEETYGGSADVPLVKGGYVAYIDAPRTVAVQAQFNF